MKHTWILSLSATEPDSVFGYTGTRNRAQRILGNTVVYWGLRQGQLMAEHITTSFIDWAGTKDDEEREMLSRATEASTLDTLSVLAQGSNIDIPEASEPNENIGYYVRQGIPLDQVIRNIHYGQEFIIGQLLDEMVNHVPAEDQPAIARDVVRVVAEFWQRITRETSMSYQRESERWKGSRAIRRQDAVKSLLRGAALDLSEVEKSLNYSLEQWHTAVVLRFVDTPIDVARTYPFERLAGELARSAGVGSSVLALPDNGYRCEIWLGGGQLSQPPSLRGLSLPESLRVAVGEPAFGVEGFRRSHDEAKTAERIGRESDNGAQFVIYRDIELASLLLADPTRAKSFVTRVIGPLIGADERSEELFQTLEQYLSSNGSLSKTAEALHMHRNTVSYRLQQIKKLISRDLTDFEVRVSVEIIRIAPRLVDGTETNSAK